MKNRQAMQDPNIQQVSSWNRKIHLPMIVSIPLLIGLLVLTTGVINKNIVVASALGQFPKETRAQLEQTFGLLDNLIYISAAMASVAGLLLLLWPDSQTQAGIGLSDNGAFFTLKGSY